MDNHIKRLVLIIGILFLLGVANAMPNEATIRLRQINETTFPNDTVASYLDQDVTSGSSPTFAGTNIVGFITNATVNINVNNATGTLPNARLNTNITTTGFTYILGSASISTGLQVGDVMVPVTGNWSGLDITTREYKGNLTLEIWKNTVDNHQSGTPPNASTLIATFTVSDSWGLKNTTVNIPLTARDELSFNVTSTDNLTSANVHFTVTV